MLVNLEQALQLPCPSFESDFQAPSRGARLFQLGPQLSFPLVGSLELKAQFMYDASLVFQLATRPLAHGRKGAG
ncbi:hypothetical protein DBA29_15405 [Xenophilus aerolatus]|nr:hypothetical protein [Xenophilus aerolatus]